MCWGSARAERSEWRLNRLHSSYLMRFCALPLFNTNILLVCLMQRETALNRPKPVKREAWSNGRESENVTHDLVPKKHSTSVIYGAGLAFTQAIRNKRSLFAKSAEKRFGRRMATRTQHAESLEAKSAVTPQLQVQYICSYKYIHLHKWNDKIGLVISSWCEVFAISPTPTCSIRRNAHLISF